MISILMSEQWTETSLQEVQHSSEGKNNIDSVTWTRPTFSHEATCCQCVFRVTNLPPLDLLHPKATFKYKKNQAKPNRRLSTKLDCYFFKQEKTKAMAAQRNL